jgi:hypothetical protein
MMTSTSQSGTETARALPGANHVTTKNNSTFFIGISLPVFER